MKKSISLFATVLSVALSAQVGIGTTNPQALLHIEGNPNNPSVNGIIMPTVADLPTIATLDRTSKIGLIVHKTTASTGRPIGWYRWDGTDWIQLNQEPNPSIYTGSGELVAHTTIAQQDKNLAFTSSATTGTNHFSVDGTTLSIDAVNDRVGIGTTTPRSNLDLHSATSSVLGFSSNNTQARDVVGQILFTARQSTNANPNIARMDGLLASNSTIDTPSGVLSFSTRNTTDGAVVERMRITENGNVGIGNSTPSANLQLANTQANRKMVIWASNNNDHQYMGLGNNFRVFRYQVDAPTSNHVFYAGTNATTSTELMRIQGNGFVGIGSTAPNAPLQFANAVGNRKIVLWEVANNDHQYTGLGINSNTLRYQVDAPTSNHIFYAGTNATTSTELMRIQGDGNVGIGTATPRQNLEVLGNSIGTLGLSSNNTQAGQNVGGIIFAARQSTHANPNVARMDAFLGLNSTAATPSGFLSFNTRNIADGATIERMRISESGFVGIGTSAPNAPLQFANAIGNRKIVLWDSNSNDHQYMGLGVNANTLRYQVEAPTGNHVFFAGANATTSTELMRIQGNGNIEIGTGIVPLPTRLRINGNILLPNALGALTGNIAQGSASSDAIFLQSNTSTLDIQQSQNNNISLSKSGTLVPNPTNRRYVGFYRSGTEIGSISLNGTNNGVQYLATSDRRLKDNIRPTQFGVSTLMKINIHDYHFKSDEKKTLNTGVLAQELNAVYPQAVSVGGDDPKTQPWSVDYSALVPLLTKAIQEQQKQIEALQQQVEQLQQYIKSK